LCFAQQTESLALTLARGFLLICSGRQLAHYFRAHPRISRLQGLDFAG
jgi:hypothetical protein